MKLMACYQIMCWTVDWTEYYFNRQNNSQERWTLKTPEQFMYKTGENNEDLDMPSHRCLDELELMMSIDGDDQSEQCLLLDLIKRMLHLNPKQRIKSLEVLQQPLFTQNLPMDYKETPDQTAGPHKVHSGVNKLKKLIKMKSKTFDEAAKGVRIYPGEILGVRYKVVDKLGKGGFGFVTKCWNIETNKMVAIKCITNHSNSVNQAKREIAILVKLQCLDPGTCNIVQ